MKITTAILMLFVGISLIQTEAQADAIWACHTGEGTLYPGNYFGVHSHVTLDKKYFTVTEIKRLSEYKIAVYLSSEGYPVFQTTFECFKEGWKY
ncbi:MAG: hypothetical protein HY074_12195 [Deltaproteobacteria bacterium]|nr:hypothetical protein [Deltaproteobacteria bacterium]